MKTLSKNEKIAVFISIVVVGFFFIFGDQLLSMILSKPTTLNSNVALGDDNNPRTEDIAIGSGQLALTGDIVTVSYVGKFLNGDVFDSSVDGEPVKFILGAGQVIPGIDKGVVGMKIGGKRLIVVPPGLAYGETGYGPIPANTTLVFEVNLLDVSHQ